MSSGGDREPSVIEAALIPGSIRGPMARFTRRGKTGGDVVRVSRLFVVRSMAAVAIPRRPFINIVVVAADACLGGVHTD
jgi:hypothetical protein